MAKTEEQKKAEKQAKEQAKIEAEAKAKAEAELKAKAKAEARALADAEAELKAKQEQGLSVADEARALGIKTSTVKLAGFKDKSKSDKMEKEQERQKKLLNKRTAKRIEKAKAKANMKPIEKRRNLLRSRLRAVKARERANTYSDANIKAWLEELQLIDSSPKMWNQLTNKGTVNFIPGNKKKRTMRDVVDSMDLEE